MNTIEKYNEYGKELFDTLLLRFEPIAIKLLYSRNEIPEGCYVPSRDGGKLPALCQAYALVRRNRKSIAMFRDDHWCIWPVVALKQGEMDEELYEAAYIDGANRFNRLWHITLPGIRTTISVMLILQVGNLLSVNFDQIYILINDMVLETGETLDYYIYRVGLYSTNNFSQATAVGLIKSLIGFVLVIATNIITKRMTDGEGGIW